MRFSWNVLTQWVDLSRFPTAQALADCLTERGLEVEAIEQEARGWERVVVAELVSKAPHPQADRLSLCQVSIGQSPLLSIVCGAQNMKVGDRVALAQEGALLPNGLSIRASVIRGQASQGMLCSEEELGLAKASSGILILPKEAPLGKGLAAYLGKEDCVLTLKVTPNRGDCLSYRGLAQELVAVGCPPRERFQEWLNHRGESLSLVKALTKAQACPFSVSLQAGVHAPLFCGFLLEGVEAYRASPPWLIKRLEQAGLRSIHPVVDATQWILLEWGHPVHAYDADCLRGDQLQVRLASSGEALSLLDGTQGVLKGEECVVACGSQVLGLAGIMGGADSQVTSQTTRVLLECALFDPSSIRRTAAFHQKKTEASLRFERGVDPEGIFWVMHRLVRFVQEVAGGQAAGFLVAGDLSFEKERSCLVDWDGLIGFLGFSQEDVRCSPLQGQALLRGLGCQVETLPNGQWKVIPPSWRRDLVEEVDFAEEVARSLGYESLPSQLPPLRRVQRVSSNKAKTHWMSAAEIDWFQRQRVKQALVAQGFCETYSFSLSHRQWLKQFGFEDPVCLQNPLNASFEALVPSLIPHLVEQAGWNRDRHFGSEPFGIRLFQLRSVFGRASSSADGQNPVAEGSRLAFLATGPLFESGLRDERGEVHFLQFKSMVQAILQFLPFAGPYEWASGAPFSFLHPGQSAVLKWRQRELGWVGMAHPGWLGSLECAKLSRAPLGLAELDWELLATGIRVPGTYPIYHPTPSFPGMERDFALWVPQTVSCDQLLQSALQAGKPLVQEAKIFDLYRAGEQKEGRVRVGVRVILAAAGRSLTEAEGEAVSERLLACWKKELEVDLRF